MDTKIAVLLVVVACLLVAVYFFGFGKGVVGPPAMNASDVLLSAAQTSYNVTTYVRDNVVTIDGSEPLKYHSVVLGERKHVKVEDALGVVRSFYVLPEGEFICMPTGKVCMQLVKNETASRYLTMANNVKGYVALPDLEKVGRFVRNGVIEPVGSVGDIVFAGRPCWKVTYSVKFDKMGDADLQETGYGRQYAPYVEQIVVECVDKQTGVLLYQNLSSSLLGETFVREFNVTYFDAAPKINDSEFGLDGEIVNGSVFAEVEAIEVEKRACRVKPEGEERNACFETAAYNANDPEYCKEIDMVVRRDLCFMTFIPSWKDARICEDVEQLKDDCYFEVAARGIDATVCGRIGSVQYGTLCRAVASGNVSACIGVVMRDDCYAHLARNLENGTICGFISNETLRAWCAGG